LFGNQEYMKRVSFVWLYSWKMIRTSEFEEM